MSRSASDKQPDDRALTDVAVGIVFDGHGRVLLAQRPAGKPYAGWWEFPGGKLEAGETVHEALARELHEELGLRIHASLPWLVREHSYEHARVRLHFRRIYAFAGEPQSREKQAFDWCDPLDPGVEPLLPASVPLMRLLRLPSEYAISCAGQIGVDAFFHRLRDRLANGLRLLQWREPDLRGESARSAFESAVALCHQHQAKVLVNSQHPVPWREIADGVHWRAADLPLARDGSATVEWTAASCHDAGELSAAAAAGIDFAVLGPVLPTASHPGAATLGWAGLVELIERTQVPVYALGGMATTDLPRACQAGAHGIAMIRGSWSVDD